MSSPALAATNQISDRASTPDDPIAAFRRANEALANASSGHASGRAAGSNLYAYVQNDPLNLTDPSGL